MAADMQPLVARVYATPRDVAERTRPALTYRPPT